MKTFKLHFNLEIVTDSEGIFFFVTMTPDWLWNLMPGEEHEIMRGSGDFGKELTWRIMGKVIEVSFEQDMEWRTSRKRVPNPSPTAKNTSPTDQITGKSLAHASWGRDRRLYELISQLEPRNAEMVLGYTEVVLWCKETGRPTIKPKSWDRMTKRAKQKMIDQAKQLGRRQ